MKRLIKITPLFLLPLLLSACNFTFKYVIPRYPGDPPSEDDGEDIDKSKNYNIKIWVDTRIEELTLSQMGAFKDDHPDIKLDFTIDTVGEDKAAARMIEDVPGGGDIYVFAQDQLNRLKTAGALTPITGDTLTDVMANNTPESVAAATIGNDTYAFPFTSDNGYFLLYDKTVLSSEDVKDMTQMMTVLKNKGKKLNFNMFGTGFYTAAYYMSTFINDQGVQEHLCSNKWHINDKNKFDSYEDNYNSANGLIASKGIYQLKNFSDYIIASDDPSKFGKTLGACVTGMWNYKDAKEAIGDNLCCAPMPSFNVGGKTYQISSFSGYKLLGVKPQEDTDKVKLCRMIAKYLSSEECQSDRFTFNDINWGPTNINAMQLPDVLAHPGLKALGEQNKYASPQSACPSGWFDAVMSLATSILKTDGSDAALQGCLDLYSGNLEDCKDK